MLSNREMWPGFCFQKLWVRSRLSKTSKVEDYIHQIYQWFLNLQNTYLIYGIPTANALDPWSQTAPGTSTAITNKWGLKEWFFPISVSQRYSHSPSSPYKAWCLKNCRTLSEYQGQKSQGIVSVQSAGRPSPASHWIQKGQGCHSWENFPVLRALQPLHWGTLNSALCICLCHYNPQEWKAPIFYPSKYDNQ